MTKEEFGILAKGMKAVYSDPKFISDNNALNVWYSLLSDLDYKVASMALQKYMQTEKFPPTPADIRAKALDVTTPSQSRLTPEEAWNMVRKAINVSWDRFNGSFEALPEIVQKAVVSPINLEHMAKMESDELATVEKSHFLRNFRTILDREKEDAQISPKLMQMINGAKESGDTISQDERLKIGGN